MVGVRRDPVEPADDRSATQESSQSFLQTIQSAILPQLQQQAQQLAPQLSVRQRGSFWIDPKNWKDGRLRSAWIKAKQTSVMAAFAPQAQVPAIESVMLDIAVMDRALQSLAPSKEKSSLQQTVREIASGLYGTALVSNTNAPITSYDPASLAGGLTLAVHVVEVHGIQFDATAASFADLIKAYSKQVRSKIEDLLDRQAWESRPGATFVQTVKRAAGVPLIVGIGIVGIASLITLAVFRRGK